ncbi:MAG: 2Fe-2S iron-sulfur cluster-binding protein, partial [Silvanigrellaceae bacterium]
FEMTQQRSRVVFVLEDLEVEVPHGTKMSDVVEAAGADVTFGCKSGTCGTCRVRIVDGQENLSSPTPEERDFLSSLGANADERLGCQFCIHGNVSIDYIGS